MNIYKGTAFGIMSLFFVLSFSQVQAQHVEDITTVGSVVAQVTQTENNFGEDNTTVGGNSSDNFGEDTTTVGGDNSSDNFGEDTTTVGGSDSSNNFEEDTTTVGGNNSSSNGNNSSSTRRNGSSNSNTDQGEVLGETTEGSCRMLTTFMRQGMNNDVEEVKFLQTFLNAKMGANLPVTGFFGSLTDAAVRDFQLKYAQETLQPWVNIGLHSSIDIATGYVYKTTQYTINTMVCPEAQIAYPVLN